MSSSGPVLFTPKHLYHSVLSDSLFIFDVVSSHLLPGDLLVHLNHSSDNLDPALLVFLNHPLYPLTVGLDPGVELDNTYEMSCITFRNQFVKLHVLYPSCCLTYYIHIIEQMLLVELIDRPLGREYVGHSLLD